MLKQFFEGCVMHACLTGGNNYKKKKEKSLKYRVNKCYTLGFFSQNKKKYIRVSNVKLNHEHRMPLLHI